MPVTSSAAKRPAGERIETIQVLRAVAALAVVAVHALNLLDARADIAPTWLSSLGPANEFGAIGVDIFFVISGFAMAAAIAARPGLTARAFLAQRAARIIPLYWLATLFAAALLVPVGMNFSPERIANSLTLFPLYLPGHWTPPMLVVGWTLMIEFAFYTAMAASLRLRPLAPLEVGLPLVLVAAMAGLALPALWPLAGVWANAIWLEFAAGIVLFRCWSSGNLAGRQGLGWVLVVVGLGGCAANLALGYPMGGGATALLAGAGPARVLWWGVPAAALVSGALILGETSARLRRTATWRLLLALGEASFALYLIHLPIFLWLEVMLPPHAPGALLLAAAVIGTCQLALWTHRRIEVPLLAWVRSRRVVGGPGIPRFGS